MRLHLLTDEREPAAVFRAADLEPRLIECLLNTTGDRPGFTFTDDAAVYLADRRDFDRGPGEKQFVGVEDVFDRHRRDARRNTEIVGDLQDRRARDAHQNAGVPVVGDDSTVFHDEQVFARPFSD